MEETNLSNIIILDDTHPQGLSFKVPGKLISKFVVNDSFIFQRFYTYDNGTVICDEVSQGGRRIRTNHEFTRDGDTVIIDQEAKFY